MFEKPSIAICCFFLFFTFFCCSSTVVIFKVQNQKGNNYLRNSQAFTAFHGKLINKEAVRTGKSGKLEWPLESASPKANSRKLALE